MSLVTCHVSQVTYQVLRAILYLIFFYKVVELGCGGSVINGTYPVWFLKAEAEVFEGGIIQGIEEKGMKISVA